MSIADDERVVAIEPIGEGAATGLDEEGSSGESEAPPADAAGEAPSAETGGEAGAADSAAGEAEASSGEGGDGGQES
jgi:hypothetical protein